MKLRFLSPGLLVVSLLATTTWAATPIINNLNAPERAEWVESEVTTAPSFSSEHLLPVDMPRGLSITIGIDPQTIAIGPDGVVRYVVVMRNPSGTESAFYEGIRCDMHTVKTYARHGSSGDWIMTTNPVWRAFTDNLPSRHAIVFARQAACKDGTAQPQDAIISGMRYGNRANNNGGMPN